MADRFGGLFQYIKAFAYKLLRRAGEILSLCVWKTSLKEASSKTGKHILAYSKNLVINMSVQFTTTNY